LVFQLEQDGSYPVEKVTVRPDTAIEMGSTGPPDLEIDLDLPDDKVEQGDQFKVVYSLRNGGTPARGVTVGIIVDSGLAVEGSPKDVFDVVSEPIEGSFQVKAIVPGKRRLVIGAQADVGDRPTVDIELVVASGGNSQPIRTIGYIAVGLLIAAAIVRVVAFRPSG